ncbi:hypothetical protein PUT78_10525 [Roseinatronobacter sp. HJB301]|uniref:CpsD/CapB family tyrosine-protein kinase n=2 Tax=Roseinatronobacter alkalisoli TaxID=3028235 RepID=A0ABT5T999_9RHOB|nr:hypothetical protein [Roseinatronobacter sp. HJB301]
MVNTRKLEQLLKRSGRSAVTGTGQPVTAPLRRGLALSGGPAQRYDVAPRVDTAATDTLNDAAWENLAPLARDKDTDKAARLFNQQARDPALAKLFDVLRTQLIQTFRKRGLRSLGITSPHAGAGTSFTTAGLLASFARRADLHVVGLDLHFADPGLHRYFEAVPNGPILPAIRGDIPVETHLQRAYPTLALGLNRPDPESIQTGAAFPAEDFTDMMQDILGFMGPDFVVCDMPPLLEGDVALNLLPGIDAVLIVSDSRRTSASDIAACERVLQDQAEFLGVVMNRDATPQRGR